MSDERLLLCSFCGGEAKVAHEYTEAWKLEYVMCFRCGCSTPPAISEDTVIQIWNTRKPMERIVERFEKSAEFYQKRWIISTKDADYGRSDAYEIAAEIVKGGGVDE